MVATRRRFPSRSRCHSVPPRRGATPRRVGLHKPLAEDLGTKPAEILGHAQAFAGVGVDTLVISITTSDPREARSALEMVAREILPAFPSERRGT